MEIVEVSDFLLAGEKANPVSGGDLGDEHRRIKAVGLFSPTQEGRHSQGFQPKKLKKAYLLHTLSIQGDFNQNYHADTA